MLVMGEKFCVLYVLITLAGMPVSVMEQVTVFCTTNTKKYGHPMTQRGPGPDKDVSTSILSGGDAESTSQG